MDTAFCTIHGLPKLVSSSAFFTALGHFLSVRSCPLITARPEKLKAPFRTQALRSPQIIFAIFESKIKVSGQCLGFTRAGQALLIPTSLDQPPTTVMFL